MYNFTTHVMNCVQQSSYEDMYYKFTIHIYNTCNNIYSAGSVATSEGNCCTEIEAEIER